VRRAWGADDAAERWLRFHPGLVGGLYHAARLAKGGAVVVPTPVYPPFLNAARDTADRVLGVDASAPEVVFDELDRALAGDAGPVTILWCHPHNPTGRVWRRAELEQLAQIVDTHADKVVAVCSDEVWSGLVLDDDSTPFVSLGTVAHAGHRALRERLVVLTSPSKTYNVAALDFAVAIVPNDALRRRYFRAGRDQAEVTPLGLAAAAAVLDGAADDGRGDVLSAADGACEAWRQRLVAYLRSNRDAAVAFVEERCAPRVRVATVPEASYLLWLDASGLGVPNAASHLRTHFGLGLNDGDPFFGKTATGFVRLNFACPRPTLEEGLQRLLRACEETTAAAGASSTS